MALRLRLCALAVLGAIAALASAADKPPSTLHLVGDHWTAWNPPATQPADAKIHIVVRGDTFWALAATNLGNPYLWPQLWEKNQYVLDAHWIYPGDPLVIGVEVVPAETVGATGAGSGAGAGQSSIEIKPDAAATAATAASGSGDRRADAAEARRNEPMPLGSERDIYCTGYVGDLDEALPWKVSGSEYEALTPRLNEVQNWSVAQGMFGQTETLKYELSFGDVVYLEGGRREGLTPGMVLVAVEPQERIRHPVTGETVGRFYAYQGRVRVLTAQEDRSIGEIVQSCGVGLHVGAQLRKFEPEPVPLARRPTPRPVNDPTSADLGAAPVILHADSSLFTLGQDHVVFIDRGETDDVYPGDLFTVYRTSLTGQPPVPVGELAVLSVRAHSAVAKIIESRYPIYLGDRLERR
jgi:hypothetical protein